MSRRATTAPATDSSRTTSRTQSSSCSGRSSSATARSAATSASYSACSTSGRRRREPNRHRRFTRCTSASASPRCRFLSVHHRGGKSMKGRRLKALGLALLAGLIATGFAAAKVQSNGAPTRTLAATGCQLNSANDNIKHVIYLQFDNTHFKRDNPNVPSDLEQMPHLLNFIRDNGTLLTNDHTALISHTATGILTSLTGVYPDRMGQPVSNSFRYFKPDGTTRTGVSFAYWTAPLFDPGGPPFPPPAQTDFTPEMINENGVTAPAPWVPYTRAGCSVGSVATANTILENTAIDIPTVFGAGSPEAAEVASNPGQAFADFVGIGVHCAQDSAICASSTHSRPDL